MIKLTSASPAKTKMEMLALPVCERTPIVDSPLLAAATAAALDLDEFEGRFKQQVMLYAPEGSGIARCLCMGIGERKKVDAERLRRFAGRAVKAAMEAKRRKLVIALPSAFDLPLTEEAVIRAVAEGACLANHVFDKYKGESTQTPLAQIALLVSLPAMRKYKDLVARTEVICKGTRLAREWITIPPNHKLPARFARMVTHAARGSGLQVDVMSAARLKQKQFGALMAVAAGSVNTPRMVEMAYLPKDADETIVLVGKGVTFDTGGINLKPSSSLHLMKIDMSGAAVVAATMIALAKLKPRQRIIGLLPLVENMCSGKATRPGDVVTSFSGKTVEIGNTDAEGRLILADAMAYAVKKYKPDTIIDLATLTGACLVALGEKIAAVFSPDKELRRRIETAGESTYERCWPMPLPEDYKKLLKSEIADINNMPSTRYGGAITAALFLSEFVQDTRWAHIDIAGPMFDKNGSDYCGPGGTGFGVRLLCDLILNHE